MVVNLTTAREFKHLFRLSPPGLQLLLLPLLREMHALGLVSLLPVLLLAFLVTIPCVLTLSAALEGAGRRWIPPVTRATVATDMRGGGLPRPAVDVLDKVS